MVQRWMRKDACMATGASADVFSPAGEFLGSIAAPRGTHGVAFGGKDKKTLFGIVFLWRMGRLFASGEVRSAKGIARRSAPLLRQQSD
jgi:sugar lactone lactonase YvrE